MKGFITLFYAIIMISRMNAQSGIADFTSSGIFTVPAGVTSVVIEVVGAGGSGGGNGTGGGGGGAYSSGEYVVTPLQVLDITVGIGGINEETGTTSVDGYLKATGGQNGVSVPNPEIGGGGLGGVPYGGNIYNYAGGEGGGGYYTYFGGGGGGAAGPLGDGGDGGNTIAWTGICLTPGGDAGISGGAPGGNGGKGAGFTDDFCTVSDPSGNGLNYGGGGGGGNGNGGGPGTGANGFCRITWCAVDVTCSVNEETIIANAVDVTYQWIDCNNGNLPIDGETNQSFTPTVSGSFAVVINDGICTDTSACFTITIIVQDIEDKNMILWYANPFYDFIRIQTAYPDSYYFLTNSIGQIRWAGKLIEEENFSKLPAGLYFLKVESGNLQQVISLFKSY